MPVRPMTIQPCLSGGPSLPQRVMPGAATILEVRAMSRGSTPMSRGDADRIAAAAAADPGSPTALSGFDDRAQDAADRNEGDDYDSDDDE